jgi:caffeoyl-CoA O-methyltransferase
MTADVDDRGVDVSLMGPQVSQEAERYADAYTTPPSPAVAALLAETQEVTPFPIMAGGSKEARLIQALVALTDARRVLEIGTFTGATALALAEALPDEGQVVTIETDESVADVARRHFDASPHGAKIELRLGDARQIVTSLAGPFDLVFIGAWNQHYIDYYEAALPKLSEHGVIVADNVIWYGLPFNPAATDAETEGARAFVAHVNADGRTQQVLLTVGDGLLVIWQQGSSA